MPCGGGGRSRSEFLEYPETGLSGACPLEVDGGGGRSLLF